MPAGFTQDNRFLSLTTSLGKDKLLINGFSIGERVSTLFSLDIDVLLTGNPNLGGLIGEPVTLQVRLSPNGPSRYFNGVVNRISIGNEVQDLLSESAGRFRRAKLSVVPKMWTMTLNSAFKVFQDRTTPDILKEVFSKYGLLTKFQLTGTYETWDWCFQYRESDFQFVSRLMEHEGIFYYFKHSDGKHVLVIGDNPAAFETCTDQPTAHFAPDIGADGEDYVSEWESSFSLIAGATLSWDFHYEKNPTSPYAAPEASTTGEVAGNTGYKVEDFPGAFTQYFNKLGNFSKSASFGDRMQKIRMEEIETENFMYYGKSHCKAFSSGLRFTMEGGPGGEYVLTSVQHSGMQYPPYLFGFENSPLYTNALTGIPYGIPFRPPHEAPWPTVIGPQTALVVEGPDEYGRFRVKFHWGNQITSGWCRVAQRWAGPEWGTIFLPRINHEVIIEFFDGDPDQPVITGSLYNAQNKVPYKLPANYTQSGIKTRSMASGGGAQGGADEFNELRFEDKQGNEDIYFHAQKDFHRYVENDDDLKVMHDQTILVQNHRTEIVKEGNEKVTIEKGKREIFIDMGDDLHQVKMGNRDVVVDMGNHSTKIKMGNQDTKIDLGKATTEAMQSIELKVGQSSIKIDQMGVTIKGMMIKIEATMMLDTKALLATHKADAIMTIKGGLTMIN